MFLKSFPNKLLTRQFMYNCRLLNPSCLDYNYLQKTGYVYFDTMRKIHNINGAFYGRQRIFNNAEKYVKSSPTIWNKDAYIHLKSILGTTDCNLGLIILLFSKVATADGKYPREVMENVETLSEIAELIYLSHHIHGIISTYGTKDYKTLYSDKLCIISGDLILSKCSSKLANLRNQNVVELMSVALRDLKIAEFKTGKFFLNAVEEWTYHNELTVGQFLGNACKACLELTGHNTHYKEKAFLFGKHFGLAIKAFFELSMFSKEGGYNTPFDLMAAPALFHLESNPLQYHKNKQEQDTTELEYLYEEIVKGSGVNKTKLLRENHARKAKEAINVFKSCEELEVLMNILNYPV